MPAKSSKKSAEPSGPAPASFNRRSPVWRELVRSGARFEALNGYACAMTAGRAPEDEQAGARTLAVADLSALPRSGFKGWNTGPWLEAKGARMEPESNRAYPQAGAGRIARLAPGEVLILGPLSGKSGLIEALEAAWSMDTSDGCYPVPRQDASFWFRVTGAGAPDMLAKLCAIDLSPARFPLHAVAQTNMARLNVIVVAAHGGDLPAYDVLGDIASAVYLWRAIADAMAEFGGCPVGLEAIRALDGTS